MILPNEEIIKEYSVIGDDLYYHHTRTERTGKDYSNEPSAHTQHELLYLLRGELSYVIEGETYRVREGDMIFVEPGEIHTLHINGLLPYERIVLLFDMSILHGIMNAVGTELEAFSHGGRNEFHIIKSEHVHRHGLDRILTELTEANVDHKYKKLDIISRLILFVSEIDRIISKEGDAFRSPDLCDPLVRAVTEYVDRHISEPLPLENIASALFVSKSTLCHKFSRLMRVSVSRYVTMKKMYRARDLIYGGMSTHSASLAVGYESYASFFYNYKRVIGSAPSARRDAE